MQDQEIFSFFEVRNVPQELRTKAQTLLVKNVDYYQKAQRLDVFVSADHMIDSPGLTEAEKLIADQAFPSHDILVRIIPRFMLNPVPTALEILEQYKDNIAWELEHKKKDIPSRLSRHFRADTPISVPCGLRIHRCRFDSRPPPSRPLP